MMPDENVGVLLERLVTAERERDEWKARAEKAEAALAELRDWPCEGIGCEVTLDSLESGGPGGGSWFCASCWNKALPAARRHGAEAQREACAKAVESLSGQHFSSDPAENAIGWSADAVRETPLVTDKGPKS